MTEIQRWLDRYTWDGEVTNGEQLRLNRGVNVSYTRAQEIWEAAEGRELSLQEAIDVCRLCYTLAPFSRRDNHVFIKVARSILQPIVKSMSPALGGAVHGVVADYVSGVGTVQDLEQILRLIRFRYLSEA